MILTFIFPDVFESELQATVFALHYPHFAKCSFSYHSQKSEVIEIHCDVSKIYNCEESSHPGQ